MRGDQEVESIVLDFRIPAALFALALPVCAAGPPQVEVSGSFGHLCNLSIPLTAVTAPRDSIGPA